MKCSMERLRAKAHMKQALRAGKTVFAFARKVQIKNNASFEGAISPRKPQPMSKPGPF